MARRPAGSRARDVYGADDIHDFARREILAALALKPDDHLLEVGRLSVYTGPELRGTPAAPEPVASRGHFYADRELEDLVRRAGLRGT